VAKVYKLSLGTRLINWTFRVMTRMGVGASYRHILTVPGRKTGQLHSTPVDVLELAGHRWLVAGYGPANWVRNARAAGRPIPARMADLDEETRRVAQFFRQLPEDTSVKVAAKMTTSAAFRLPLPAQRLLEAMGGELPWELRWTQKMLRAKGLSAKELISSKDQQVRVDLHHSLGPEIYRQALSGDYQSAAINVLPLVEKRVRRLAAKAGQPLGTLSSVQLMEEAFGEHGPLVDQSLARQAQIAMERLFAGAMGFFRNRLLHEEWTLDDPNLAAEALLLADLLLRLLDQLPAKPTP
jgi:uncharacterized protein (TIGR02391 family)